MIIRVEPKAWSMYSVLLFFDAQSPDAEDESIKQYLNDHKLFAKRKRGSNWKTASSTSCHSEAVIWDGIT